MTNNRLPFVGSGRVQEGGTLTTRKQDFNAHVQGTGFRHDATNIDMNPIIALVGGTTVQETLERLHNLIVSAGTGFLSIGSVDGYVQGDYNVGAPATPTLYDTFNATFADTRLQNGGLILVLAGTYHLRASVTVPAGISIMGELSGTTIIGEMQEVPMFVVQKPNTSIDLVSGIPFDTGSNVDIVKFMNLVLVDNLDGYVLFGEPSMTTAPMIQAQISSNLVCENVSFVGRVHTGATPRTKTQAAIGYTGSGTTGTILKMKDCYMDGLRVGISFTPGSNASDFLTVENCKARIYGTENAASQSPALNSFIVMSHCNAIVSNNYFVGTGAYVNTFIDIVSGNGSSTKLVITGNYGRPNTLISGKIINDAAGTVFTSVITGNAWGTTVDSPWYIVVGGGVGSSLLGDFNGSGAIDTIFSLANSISSFEATVVVNPGTYTVTGSGGGNFANLKFIGNKYGKAYPIINFSLLSGSNDSLGNLPVVFGNKIQSLQFTSTTNKHSMRPGFNPLSGATQSSAHTMEVIDCIFTNTALYAMDLSAKPWLDTGSHKAMTNIVVKDCYFFQDGTFTNTVSCILPLADQVHVENCIFTGNGYALSIGHNGYTFANASLIANVSLKNSIFDLTGYTITTQNSLEKSYVYVDAAANLSLENCQILADNQYDDATPISGTLTNSFSQPFEKFIYLKSENLYIDDCVFVGPAQTFVSSAVTYAMTTLFVEPSFSARIRNSRFNSGACLLQTGNTAMTNGSFRESFVVENCFFTSGYQTLVDYDVNVVSEDAIAYFVIDKCNFINGIIAEKPLHTNTTDTTRCGVVQLFTGDSYVSFTNNIMNVSISSVTGRTLYGALMINGYDNSGTPGDQANPVIVSNNSIFAFNHFTAANAVNGAASVLLRTASMQVENNKLSLSNTAAISASFIGCLMIDNPETASGNDSMAVITGNTFSRKNFVGGSSNLARGYIQISATSSANNGGLISNNMFDSTTYNGSSTALVEDNSTTISNNIIYSNWVITQNKNQSGHQQLTWASGAKGVATGADLNKAILYGGVVSASSISADATASDTLVFNYAHTGAQDQFRWNICLSEILPPGVTVTKIEYRFQSSAIPGTTKTVNAVLSGADGDTNDSNTIAGTSVIAKTITPSFNYTTKSTDQVYFHIQANINHSAPLTVTLSQIFITYHW